MSKIDLRNLDKSECEELAISLGEKAFRGRQLFSWIQKGIVSLSEINNLPKKFIDRLRDSSYIYELKIIKKQVSKEDETKKYLFELEDGNKIESVFMKYKYGNSLCISSQAGCKMGCKFCASTIDGKKRNLTAGELLSQFFEAERDSKEKINHIVIMGTGEPFDNYGNLCKFLKIINSKDGVNLSLRNITVSTCGILPKILEFARDFKQVNLAISLHGANDFVRGSMMPINEAYPIKELIKTCHEYVRLTGRRITFEYTMVKGVNDSDKDLEELIRLTKGLLCHVNLISLNEVEENNYESVSRKKCKEFQEKLERAGVPATVRRELGADIDGACGQLRLK